MTTLMSPHPGFPGANGGSAQPIRLPSAESEVRWWAAVIAGVAITVLLLLTLSLVQAAVRHEPPVVPSAPEPIALKPPSAIVVHAQPTQEPSVIPVKPVMDEPAPKEKLPVLPIPAGPGTKVNVSPTFGPIGDLVPPIYDPGDLDRNPTPIHTETPVVRNELLRTVETVVLEFVVTPAGVVTGVKVISSTDRELEEPAVQAIYRWRFEPGIKDGKPVATRMRLPIQFHPAN